jgi:fructokinase
MEYTIAAYGEALWDLLPTGPVLGGAPLNFAYRAVSLGNRGGIVSRLGTDELGEKTLQQMRSLGMEAVYIQRDGGHPTGTVNVRLDEAKNPDYDIVQNVAYDYIEKTAIIEDLIKKSDCLCFGTLIQRSKVSRCTLIDLIDLFSGQYILLDINLRRNCYTREIIISSMDRANVLKLNDDEALVLAEIYGISDNRIDRIVEALVRKADLRYCVATLGSRGALGVSREKEIVYLPTYHVNIQDTCGAGDAFTAGFIHSLLGDKPLRDAIRFGNAMGALVAGQEGATQPVRQEEIQELMEKNRPERIDNDLVQYMEV